jgi:catechol 2,3-dioxygenase-like lactoylglutathione lyase family enzyme
MRVWNMKVRRIDHVGIIVNDLAAAKAFFIEFGLEVMGEQELEGELVDRVVGLRDVKSEIVMMRSPDGGTNLELAKFHRPADGGDLQPALANAPGIRHIAFVVEDIEAVVAKLEKRGAELFGEIQNYKNVYKVCYVRGPEGIILELAEEIGEWGGGGLGGDRGLPSPMTVFAFSAQMEKMPTGSLDQDGWDLSSDGTNRGDAEVAEEARRKSLIKHSAADGRDDGIRMDAGEEAVGAGG